MTEPGRVVLSMSTWQQPMPQEPGPERAVVIGQVVDRILAAGEHRLRIGIDGLTAAGKTSLGHELAREVTATGRDVARASFDDFKRPWKESHLYDRTSGEGYYRNAYDLDAARRLLLDPAAPDGSGRVALCSIDPITQIDHSTDVVDLPADAVLIVDGVFAFRPELDDAWDLRIWVDIDSELSVRRGTERDAEREGAEEAEALHRDRYLVAEEIYIDEVDPVARAEVIVDNTDLDRPLLRRV